MSVTPEPLSTPVELTALIPADCAGQRLDQALASVFSQYSRARLQRWIEEDAVRVDGVARRAKDRMHGGERVEINARITFEVADQPQNIPLDIIYEDAALIVLNKPAGLVAHPAVGNRAGTLLNALLHHAPELAQVPRAGIVHRLDKDTSGLLVVTRNLIAQNHLIRQLQARTVAREYETIINGVLVAGGTVDAPIGRHPTERMRMAVEERGRDAITHYRVIQRFRAHTHVRVHLETGRTHQIRVHMSHIRHPIVGDPTYGGRLRMPPRCTAELGEQLRHFPRQALHAARLSLVHPDSGETMSWSAPVPADMQALLAALAHDAQAVS